ncbi:MAG: tRNA pseudouridine(38-40) synthase TruA [Alphaproteobacteria bacterium]|nr:tRNA pseudouridine(38-40) synthase TruA [Alphaproteobacteria bacterium]
MTTRWKLTIEYDGSGFSGWQKQANAISVQSVLEEALSRFSAEDVSTFVAGRTDARVHANGQVAHVDLEKETTGEVVRDAVNFYLKPHKVSVLSAEAMGPEFHARLNARRRSYRYRILNRRPPLTYQTDYAWHVVPHLDEIAMQRAADILIGKHDFSTFRASNCQANSPLRTLDTLKVSREDDEIWILAEARSFLYHQVRNMVGTLGLVGNGNWSLDDFRAAFEACDRTKGGPTAPPQGLYFWGVYYPDLPENS